MFHLFPISPGNLLLKMWFFSNGNATCLYKFHIAISSESCLKKFLLEIANIKFGMEQELLSILSWNHTHFKTESPQRLSVKVYPELFLISPNLQKTKGADRSHCSRKCLRLLEKQQVVWFWILVQEEDMCRQGPSHWSGWTAIILFGELGGWEEVGWKGQVC